MRHLITSGSPWEATVGYSRAVVVDDMLFVSGTAATDASGRVVAPGLYEQTRFALASLGTILEESGFALADVVSSRLSVSDFDNWAEAARAHGEAFSDIRPAFALVHALPFVDPEILVEVELIAKKSR